MAGELLLVAASGLAREAAESARRGGWDVIGCVDDDPALGGTDLLPGLTILGPIEDIVRYPNASLLLCTGKGGTRQELAGRLSDYGVNKDRYGVVVDPSVNVSPTCIVGAGSILLQGTILTSTIVLGRHTVCMPGVILTHDDVVEDYATLAGGAALGGGVTIGTAAYVGMGATVRQNLYVGANSTLGMGSVLLDDLPDGQVWAGVPAVLLMTNGPQEVLRTRSVGSAVPRLEDGLK